eukprot:SAG11_NODE_32076_length_286_cov_1.385027_1_plen_70_part_01
MLKITVQVVLIERLVAGVELIAAVVRLRERRRIKSRASRDRREMRKCMWPKLQGRCEFDCLLGAGRRGCR